MTGPCPIFEPATIRAMHMASKKPATRSNLRTEGRDQRYWSPISLPNSRRVVNTILDKWPARDRGSGAFSNRHATRIDTQMSIGGGEKRRGYPGFAAAPHQVADNLSASTR
jgi:hypothetical protein